MNVFFHPGGAIAGLNLPAGWWFNCKDHIHGRNGGNPFPSKKSAETGLRWHLHHLKWQAVWRAAKDNMPLRNPHWEDVSVTYSREAGTVPIGEYIKKHVKGEMRHYGDFIVEDTIEKQLVGFGQQNALARLMGYNMKKGGHNAMYNNWMRGSKPRDPVKEALLLRLAGLEGKSLALKMLTDLGYGRFYNKAPKED